ncbi:MAG TPA: CPBP family intramembrane glutamic endopeptidase [Rhizomicrobium sp.]|nr:CPBP family intramembrane glutamic endopeptidase [Rhizomicrobium sp.]
MKRWGLWLFLILAFGITWGLAGYYILSPADAVSRLGPIGFTNPLIFLAVWSPTLSAFIAVLIADGRRGLAEFWSRLTRWRIAPIWYAAAVLGTAALALSARYLHSAVAGSSQPQIFDVAQYPHWLFVGLVTLVADPGPLGEDPGWRGFAQPRMLARWNGLTVGILLGLIWGIWHLPSFFLPGMPQASISIPWFVACTVPISILMVWLSNRAAGSAIPAILVHWSLNRFNDFSGDGAMYMTAVYGAAALLVLLVEGPRLGKSAPATA